MTNPEKAVMSSDRDEFEQWASATPHIRFNLARGENGLYKHVGVRDAWDAWQASRSAMGDEFTELRKLYSELLEMADADMRIRAKLRGFELVPIAAPAVKDALPGADGELPERDTSRAAEQQGLFRKFSVTRADGSDQKGGRHEGCEYFVLDVKHDKHAGAALLAYADSCKESHPELAKDMRDRYGLASPPPAVPAGEPVAEPFGWYLFDSDEHPIWRFTVGAKSPSLNPWEQWRPLFTRPSGAVPVDRSVTVEHLARIREQTQSVVFCVYWEGGNTAPTMLDVFEWYGFTGQQDEILKEFADCDCEIFDKGPGYYTFQAFFQNEQRSFPEYVDFPAHYELELVEFKSTDQLITDTIDSDDALEAFLAGVKP
jgi:hypothetical protein